MSSGTSSAVRTTRTGRRVVPTLAAAAAASDKADKAASSTEKEKEKPTATTEKIVAEKSTPPVVVTATTRANTRGSIRPTKETPKEKETVKSSTVPVKETSKVVIAKDKPETKEDDAPKRRGLRSTIRVSSGSNDDSAPETPTGSPAKRVKLIEPEIPVDTQNTLDVLSEAIGKSDIIMKEDNLEEDQAADSDQHDVMEGQDITDDSQIFAAVAKMNAEAQQQQGMIHAGNVIVDAQQQSAVDSILGDTSTIQIVSQNAEVGIDVGEAREFVTEEIQTVEINPPWNEQGCIICNVDIAIDDPVNQSTKSEQLKEFFLEFFSIGDQISLDDETAFPFCSKCSEEMEGLLSVSQNIESMHKQFNKVRDSMAKKAIKTFLSRTKPNCLEDDAKSENYGFMDEEQKKSYKDQMFSLWKSRYELVQPGPKTPIMIRSMDSRGRVTVVRLNSHGQAVPDKFGGIRGVVRPDVPLGRIPPGLQTLN